MKAFALLMAIPLMAAPVQAGAFGSLGTNNPNDPYGSNRWDAGGNNIPRGTYGGNRASDWKGLHQLNEAVGAGIQNSELCSSGLAGLMALGGDPSLQRICENGTVSSGITRSHLENTWSSIMTPANVPAIQQPEIPQPGYGHRGCQTIHFNAYDNGGIPGHC